MVETGALFLKRYASRGLIGRGSMGSVYRASPLDRPDHNVVVKIMLPHVASQPRFRQLFEREVQSLAALRHPYIVRLIDSSFDSPHGPLLVMEYVSGVTLEDLLSKTGRLSVGRTGLLLGSLCHALDSAHSAGIVHLDLKPSNLMIVAVDTLEESLRVMDFGLACFSSKPHITLERLAGQRNTSVQGTPCYICPEQLRGDEVDARADLYSVGVMLFEMLTGQSPFPYHDIDKILRAHVHEKPPSFASLGIRNLSPMVEQAVQVCLTKFPAERPATARDLAKLYSEGVGIDVWEAAAPAEMPEATSAPAKTTYEDERNAIVHHLDAWMPEVIAVVKLRGFLEDKGGQVVESAPGLLRIRLGMPKQNESSSRNRLTTVKSPAERPIEIELRMEKPDPKKNLLQVTVLFRPYTDPVLLLVPAWRTRCEALYRDLQSYLIAR